MKFTVDFETTTDPDDCRVWAYGICSIDDFSFKYGNNINDFFENIYSYPGATFYFHNLKFDGEFCLYYLLSKGYKWCKKRKPGPGEFTTLISDKGVFYSITLGTKTDVIQIYDSLKILPFSVAEIAKAFNLEVRKGEIDYDKYRPVGYELDEVEKSYLYRDVYIPAKALSIMFKQKLTRMTTGSNAFHDFKSRVKVKNFKKWFPVPEYDADIRQSYKGGFTYCNPKYQGKEIEEGIVLDVNSLYPYVMYDKPLPYGEGKYFKGRYKNDKLYNLYIQMFKCSFELKERHIPTIQLKNNLAFIPTQYLSSSEGEEITLCLTSVDLELFLEHYEVKNVEWLSGWKFKSSNKLFREYIDYWISQKIEADKTGNKALRTLAKLMLNSLYGKFALNPNVRSKIPYLNDDIVKYKLDDPETREPIYIPVGTFVTAWARHKTITSAQKVYDRFMYADTDSLHLYGRELPDGLEIDPYKLGAWKHEGTFVKGRYLRQKTYMEEMLGDYSFYLPNLELYGSTHTQITCAGMPKGCYQYVNWDNFYPGTVYPGKLQFKHVKKGIILKDIDFTIKK